MNQKKAWPIPGSERKLKESGWYRARVGIIRRKTETLEGQSLSDPIDHNSKFRYFSSSASEMGRH